MLLLMTSSITIAQSLIYQLPNAKALRSGTYSFRNNSGTNNGAEPKTWTFHDQTSWDSKFYNGKTFSNASMSAGSITLTTATSSGFNSAADVGKVIEVFGAGPGGVNLITTIASVGSTSQITLSTPASTTVSNVIIRYGSADKTAYTEGHYTQYGYGNFEMNYRLLFPAAYNQNEDYKYPLIVMMHGAGERANCWGGTCFANVGLQSFSNGSIASGSYTLTSATANFVASDDEKYIEIDGADKDGQGNNITNYTYISSVINSTTITVYRQFSFNGSGTNKTFRIRYGTDPRYRSNDLNLVHSGQPHLEAIYNATTGSNGKKPDDPTLHPRAFPGFVVFPQNESGWSSVWQVHDIIDLLIAAYDIDPDRIYIHGLSDGGAGTWETLRLRPELFAAILPMSATIPHGSPIFTTEVSKAVPIPSWIFQGGVDGSPSPNNTNQLVDKLRAAGASVRYKIYPTVGHGTWGPAYAETDFFSWMLKQNKRNITVLYGDSTLCATDNSGVRLALSQGFAAYQWELDGNVISGATSSTYTATVAGRYRARFSRVANPNESQWNLWSKPVNVRETPATTVSIAAVGTARLPDINGGTSVRINGPTTKDLVKLWSNNGTQTTSYNVGTKTYFSPFTDTANFVIRTNPNPNVRVSLKTIPLSGCASLESNSIYVTSSTPVNLIAPVNPTAQSTAPGTIQLFWTDNTPDETGFEIFRSPTGNPNSYNFFKLLPEGTISYTDTGLTPGATYYYQLRAINNTLVSAYTGNISAVAGPDTQAPTAPQSLTFTNRTLTTITLSWAASTDNVGIASYTIYYGATSVSTNSNASSFTVTGLTGNSNYLFTVKAFDLAGNGSSASNQLTASTIFSGLNYTYSAVNVDLLTDAGNNWNSPEVTGTRPNFNITPRGQDDFFNFKFEGYIMLPAGTYQFRSYSDDGSRVYVGAQGASAYPFNPASPSTNLVFDNDGLHACTIPSNPIYTSIVFNGTTARPITVIMFEKQGGECLIVEYKESSSLTWITIPDNVLNSGPAPALTPPLPPTALMAATNGMSSINLNWIAASGANSYEIYRSIGNSTSYSIIANSSTTTFSDTSLTPNTTYNYQLKSVSSTTGSSTTFSSVSSATTAPDTQAPTIPTNVVVISSNYTNASFQWMSSTDNVAVVGYKIFANSSLLGTTTTTTYYTTALQPANSYTITVSAYDASGNESSQSTGATCNTTSPQTFYSLASAIDLTQLSSWNTNTNGSGAPPTNFSFNGQYFVVQSNNSLTSPLTIGGNVSRVIVNDGISLNINQPLTGTLRVGAGSTVNVNVDYQPSFETVAANSTVNFNNATTTIPVANYGNLVVNGSSLKNVGSGTLQVLGNLTLSNGVGIKGAPSNTSTISVAGDLITGSSILQPASDNEVALQFTGIGSHAITGVNNQSFYKLAANAGAIVTFNNTSGSPKSLNLGTSNGGGIELANGSSLVLGSNNLVLTDNASVNPANTTGSISINTGSIQLTSNASLDENFYFAPTPNNRVTNFTMQETGSGTVQIRQPVEIYSGLKINGGTLTTNGNVILKSRASSSASIQQIVNGNITGNVTVERYMDPKRVYRYIASPVAGLRVADWQNYFPITGSFTDASTGPGLGTSPSLFFYNETLGLGQLGFAAYPTTNNQAAIVPGRGYAAFIREGTNPTTLISTGAPTQGNFSFTLTGGAAPVDDGWNLIGNPYASDVTWSTNGWTSSGVGNVVYVRENLLGGGIVWRTWDRSNNTGNLTGGRIPAGQAFWVQTNTANPTLTITEATKVVQSLPGIFRSGDDSSDNVFSIKLENGTLQDYAYLSLTKDGDDQYDKMRDGFKNRNSYFNISTSSKDGIDLAMNNLGNSFCDKIVAVNLATINPGTYTLQFDNLDNFSLANIQLIDSLTLTTSTITASNPQYTINVSSEAASYKNRLFLKLTRPSINTNNVVASAKDVFCRSEEVALVEVKNSQPGVVYEAISSSNGSLSAQVIGNGETIQLAVRVKELAANQNTIRVRSSFTGCNASILANSKVISVSELPTFAIESTVNGCLGSTLDLTATGNAEKYEWRNENSGQVLTETSSTLRISVINPVNSYLVTAFTASGCKGETKYVVVRADMVETPQVTFASVDTLQTNGINGVQWLFNGHIIPGANASQFKPEQSGSYSVKTKNTFCVKESAPVEYLITGTEPNQDNQFKLFVYPNPSEKGSKFTVLGSSPINNNLQLSITDLMGKQLSLQNVSLSEYEKGIPLEPNLQEGVYLVLVTQNGKTIYQKIVIR